MKRLLVLALCAGAFFGGTQIGAAAEPLRGATATFRFSISVRTPEPAHVRVHWRESCMLDGIGWIERGQFFDRSPLLRSVGRPEIANWCHLTAWVRNLDHPRQTPRVVVRTVTP